MKVRRQPFRETVVRGHVSTQHLAQLFDSSESLADVVSEFMRDGYLAGDALLVVSTRDHWKQIASRLRSAGVPLDAVLRTQQLTFEDAAETLGRFMRSGQPDGTLFDGSVGALVRQRTTIGRPLRIYGEMVDVLAAEGDYRNAQQVEELWNQLSERESFTLFCGYSSVNFGDPRTLGALRAICGAHTHVQANPRDLLGSFLLAQRSA